VLAVAGVPSSPWWRCWSPIAAEALVVELAVVVHQDRRAVVGPGSKYSRRLLMSTIAERFDQFPGHVP
jgi:hypothetical protein